MSRANGHNIVALTLRLVCFDRVDRVFFSTGAFFSFTALAGGTNAGGGILLPSFVSSSSDNSMVGLVSNATISNESFKSSDGVFFALLSDELFAGWSAGSSTFSFFIRTVLLVDAVDVVVFDWFAAPSVDTRSTLIFVTDIVSSRRIFVLSAGSFWNMHYYFEDQYKHNQINQINRMRAWSTYITCCFCSACADWSHQLWFLINWLIIILNSGSSDRTRISRWIRGRKTIICEASEWDFLWIGLILDWVWCAYLDNLAYLICLWLSSCSAWWECFWREHTFAPLRRNLFWMSAMKWFKIKWWFLKWIAKRIQYIDDVQMAGNAVINCN